MLASHQFDFQTAVLGIGERVGITPLGGLVACLYAANPEYVKSKYNLPMLREIENLVAEAVEINVPFNNPITYVTSSPSSAHWLLMELKADTVHSHTRQESTLKLSSTTPVHTKSLSRRISV